MNRLTEFHNGIWGMSVQAVKDGYDKYSVLSKLAEYENLQEKCIELTGCGLAMLDMKYKEFIDDIAELYSYRQAEKQGLLKKLPCKVGDTVYIINSCKQICERSCCGFSLYTDMILKIWYRWISEETRMSSAGKLGIDVFLTKEAAEEALKGSEGE
jgi:hypothetical protein